MCACMYVYMSVCVCLGVLACRCVRECLKVSVAVCV